MPGRKAMNLYYKLASWRRIEFRFSQVRGISFFYVFLIIFNLQICVVREAAVQNLKSLAEIFGQEWASEHIIPQVFQSFTADFRLLLV